MPVSESRIVVQGYSQYPHEQQAIEWLRKALPDSEPYRLWALAYLVEPSGRRYEIDALVLGYHALYLVEIKSHPATVKGNAIDWIYTYPDGSQSIAENPLRLADQKARKLAGLLEGSMRDVARPWVEPLIFLAHPDAKLALPDAARANVVTRADFVRAVTHADFPGASPRLQSKSINKPIARNTVAALNKIGIAASKAQLKVGEYILGSIIEDAALYQDREAQHERLPAMKRRVRSYLVERTESDGERDRLRRAAEREARILTAIGDHPSILKVADYLPEGPLGGPCIQFEHLPEALALDAFLRTNPELTFGDRVRLIELIASGLSYCHRKRILHRALHPGAVLVRRKPGSGDLEVRLYNFQGASQEDGSQGTRHFTTVTSEMAALYRAPEQLEDPSRATVEGDLFSLGAIAFHVLTGRPVVADLSERQRRLEKTGYLSLAAADDRLVTFSNPELEEKRKSLEQAMELATSVNLTNRGDDVLEWFQLFEDAITDPNADADKFADPLTAKPGDRLDASTEVLGILGTGASARVLKIRTPERECAVKVALSPELESRLRSEAAALKRVKSNRIVELFGLKSYRNRNCLLLAYAGETLASRLRKLGPVSLDLSERWGGDLLTALEDLEENGLQHRDIKPANLGIAGAESKQAEHLILFDFSLASTNEASVTAGTPAYKDPFLLQRGRWDPAADRWSAAATLYEMLTL